MTVKEQIVSWVKERKLFVILSIILVSSFPFLIGIAFLFGVVAVFSEAMLTAMIEAIATLLGFFGLIFVYALTSLDKRIKMYNDAWFELHKNKDMTPEYNQVWIEAVENLDKNKKKLVNNSLVTGIFLVLSLLLAILASGFPNEEIVLYLTAFSMGLFFSSILQIFSTIYDLGKDPAKTVPHLPKNFGSKNGLEKIILGANPF